MCINRREDIRLTSFINCSSSSDYLSPDYIPWNNKQVNRTQLELQECAKLGDVFRPWNYGYALISPGYALLTSVDEPIVRNTFYAYPESELRSELSNIYCEKSTRKINSQVLNRS